MLKQLLETWELSIKKSKGRSEVYNVLVYMQSRSKGLCRLDYYCKVKIQLGKKI
jgi:hypothetical protein